MRAGISWSLFIDVKTKAQDGKGLCQGYPVNWWLWLNLSSGLLKPNPMLVWPHQSFKICGSQTTCIKIVGVLAKWSSPGAHPQTSASGNIAGIPIHKSARYLDEHVLTHGCHNDVFFTTPRDGLGSMQATHNPLPMDGSVFRQPESPVLNSRMFFCPPIVVIIMSMWRSQNCSTRKNIFVVILSLPIISLKKTVLPPDIQTGWFMQSG